MEEQLVYHKPVLTEEIVHYLAPEPNEVYIDATFGSGGHTRAILEKQKLCKVIAIDWDKTAIEVNGPALEEEFGERLQLVWGSFGRLTQILKKLRIKKVNGIIADFGTSQFQITQKPGFSFAVDSPLDMRMSPGHYKVTAYDIVNKASEAELAKIFRDYGQEKFAYKIAQRIVKHRSERGRLRTTLQLAKLIESVIPVRKKIHPATKVFQALRIVVNNELNNIKSLLTQSLDLLEDNGRLVCISFHSLEDSIVKEFIKQNSDALSSLIDKVVVATQDEIIKNPSARSAKLRAAIRLSRC